MLRSWLLTNSDLRISRDHKKIWNNYSRSIHPQTHMFIVVKSRHMLYRFLSQWEPSLASVLAFLVSSLAFLNLYHLTLWGLHIRYPVDQVFTLQSITVAKLQLGSSSEVIIWLGGAGFTTTKGSVLKGGSSRKAENHCSTAWSLDLDSSTWCISTQFSCNNKV